MDDHVLRTRLMLGMAEEQRILGSHAPKGEVIERDGVVASIVGSVPDSSLANAIVTLEPAMLTRADIDALSAAYDGAGVRKWGVWVDPQDADTLAVISTAGLVFDSHPTPMGAPLADIALADAAAVRTISLRDAGRVNDLANGYADGRFERLLGSIPEDVGRTYGMLDDDGEPVSAVVVLERDGDAVVWLVATVPWARDQGHAKRLMRRALLEARERGCVSTTLVASALGRPVYATLGYRTLGELHLWEHRS